jgi:hypothetical protein
MFRGGWRYLIAALVVTGVPVGTSLLDTEGGAAAAPTTITIDANNPSFTDSGVAVTLNEPFSIKAAGLAQWTQITPSTGPSGYRFPQSNGTHTCGYDQYHPYEAPSFLAPGLNCWSLVGRIGATGTIFFIGTTLNMPAPLSGELYLAFNDDFYPNNSGDFVATITTS